MAENKKSFLFYVDWWDLFKELSREERGDLITHMLEYVNDESPVELTGVVKIAFIPMKAQLKRDLKKWEVFIDKQSINGKKGGRPTKKEETQKTQAFFNKAKKAVTVTVTDTVTVNDTVNVKENKDTLRFPFFGSEFMDNWNLLLTQKKWKKKGLAALQASLNKLGKYNEKTAIQMIQNTIAGEWQGLFEVKTDNPGKIESFLNNVEQAKTM